MRRRGPPLVLVPTVGEKQRLESSRSFGSASVKGEAGALRIEVCGFGVVAAAARSMALIRDTEPRLVLLVGIAGTYDESRLAVGEATEFDEVVCDGIGVGQGVLHRPAGQMGFDQFAAEIAGGLIAISGGPTAIAGGPTAISDGSIGDRVRLAGNGTPDESREGAAEVHREGSPGRVLVSVCAASADADEAATRRARYPNALAEDMEGFGVAMSCRMAGVPLRIIRGVSNRVGDREHSGWKIGEALDAAAGLVFEAIGRGGRSLFFVLCSSFFVL